MGISGRGDVLDVASRLLQTGGGMLLEQIERLAKLWQASLNFKG